MVAVCPRTVPSRGSVSIEQMWAKTWDPDLIAQHIECLVESFIGTTKDLGQQRRHQIDPHGSLGLASRQHLLPPPGPGLQTQCCARCAVVLPSVQGTRTSTEPQAS